MKFLEAIENLRCGFQVRRSSWGKGLYLVQRGQLVHLIIENTNSTKILSTDVRFSLNDINAEDWELN